MSSFPLHPQFALEFKLWEKPCTCILEISERVEPSRLMGRWRERNARSVQGRDLATNARDAWLDSKPYNLMVHQLLHNGEASPTSTTSYALIAVAP